MCRPLNAGLIQTQDACAVVVWCVFFLSLSLSLSLSVSLSPCRVLVSDAGDIEECREVVRHVRLPPKTHRPLFLHFSYVCPEPVSVK